jgi:hypothetical protein
LSAVLDAGALVAIDRRDREVGAILRVLQRQAVPILTSAGVVAQVWRDGTRQANLARVLHGVNITALDGAAAKNVGELLKANRTADVVDAHVALLIHPQDQIFTSDDADILALLRTRKMKATVILL